MGGRHTRYWRDWSSDVCSSDLGFPPIISNKALVHTQSITIGTVEVVVICVSLALMLLLRIIVMKTKIGTAMRAVSYNQQAASLMGIRSEERRVGKECRYGWTAYEILA